MRIRKFPPNLFEVIFMSFIIFSSFSVVLAETVLEGDYVINSSNGEGGNLRIADGGLDVNEAITAQNVFSSNVHGQRLSFGFQLEYGVILTHDEDARVTSFQMTDKDASFLWKGGLPGLENPKMQLDGSNLVTLYKGDGSGVGITLNPNTGVITSGGLPLATQAYVTSASASAVSAALGAAVTIAGGAAGGAYSVALAGGTTDADHAVSIGINTSAAGTNSVAMANGYTEGSNSVAGAGGMASGDYSSAFSFGNAYLLGSTAFSFGSALANDSVAGSHGVASGEGASAFSGGQASGVYSFASGAGVEAKSISSAAFGRYNLNTPQNPTEWIETDNVFTVGNGVSGMRSNAMAILKNGQTTLANKHWNSQTPLAISANGATSSNGNALVVDGHAVLNGKVTISQPQGDINMGIYQ